MNETDLFTFLVDILNDSNEVVSYDTTVNMLEYDSLTKVNVFVALATFAENDNVDLEALLLCENYGMLVNLGMKMKMMQ